MLLIFYLFEVFFSLLSWYSYDCLYLSTQIKHDLAIKDAELDELQQAVHAEKIKSKRLESLIQKCTLSSSSSAAAVTSYPICASSVTSAYKPLVAAVSAALSPGKKIPSKSKGSLPTPSHHWSERMERDGINNIWKIDFCSNWLRSGGNFPAYITV